MSMLNLTLRPALKDWLRAREEEQEEEEEEDEDQADHITPAVRKLFKDASFNPLPLTFIFSTASGNFSRHMVVQPSEPFGATLLQSLVKMPSLAPLICSNGYRNDFEDSLYICRSIFASRGSSSEQIFSRLRQLHEDGVIRVSRTAASIVIASMRGELEPCGAHFHVRHPHVAAYDALLQLDNEGLLGFGLEYVIEKVIKSWRVGSGDATMTMLLERIDEGESRVT